VFGHGRHHRHHRRRGGPGVAQLTEAAWQEAAGDTVVDDEPVDGPFDEAEAPDDGVSRLDLGSVRLPLPDGAQLQVEVDPAGPVRAVHVLIALGQLTVSAFAAPRSEGLWDQVRREIVEQLRADGGTVDEVAGPWGREVHAETNRVLLRFVGVNGPRWLLRGVAAGQPQHHGELVEQLYDVLRGTVVVRGAEAMPVRSPLPFTLPGPMAEQLKQVTAARQEPHPAP
jgi:Protein of unknown function (DUF3710)